MPFPTTALLDDFSGPNEDPIVSHWIGPLLSTDSGQLAKISNQLTNATGGGTDTSSYWDFTIFGADQEAWITVATASAVNADQYKLFGRMINPGTASVSGYELHIQKDASTDIWQIRRRDNLTPTTLGADMAQEISSGDSVGLSIIGTTISAYYKPAAGGWMIVGSRTDSTYTAPGVIGVKSVQTVPLAWKGTNFGGGTAITATPPADNAPPRIMGYGAC